jgi:hypothetical protein
MTAEGLMLIGGVTAFVLTVYRVRHRALREKYALLWLALAFVLLICGLFPRLIMSVAEVAHLSYISAVVFVALAAIYLFAFTVSTSLTRLYRRNVRLMQEIALLEERVKNLESRNGLQSGRPAEGRTGALTDNP